MNIQLNRLIGGLGTALIVLASVCFAAVIGHRAEPVVVRFDFAKADLKLGQATEAEFASAAQVLNIYPYAMLEIDGYTDAVGPDRVNLKLSEERAAAVRRHFIERYGIAPERIVINAHGKRAPLAPNDTARGRSENRSVLARVYRLEPDLSSPGPHTL